MFRINFLFPLKCILYRTFCFRNFNFYVFKCRRDTQLYTRAVDAESS